MGAYGKAIRNEWTRTNGVLTDKAALKETGIDQALQIIEWNRQATRQGLDVNGQKFGPYTKEYAKLKGSSLVDLYVSGSLNKSRTVKNIRVSSSTNGAEIAFDLTVNDANQGKLRGLSTGRLGRARRPARESVGLAKAGTALRRRQETALKAIAKKNLALHARAKGVIIQENL